MRRVVQVGGGIVLALALVVGVLVGLHLWRKAHTSALEQALALAPKDAERYGFTDWTFAHGSQASLLTGDDAATTSAVVGISSLKTTYGFAPADLDWELLVGSPDVTAGGQVDLLQFPDSYDLGALAGRLRTLKYTAPSSADGVWDGSSAAAAEDSPLLAAIAIDQKRHLVMLSDDTAYLSKVVDELGSSPDLPDGIAQVAGAVGSPISAQLYSGSYVCGTLSLGNADPTTEAQGKQLIAQAGPINPISGFALADQPDQHVSAAMSFDDHDEATVNATTRAKLAAGPAVGQGEGDFSSMFTLGQVAASGPVVTMDLTPVEDDLYADLLSGGPILFASC